MGLPEMITDLTFITNERNRSLLERFHVLIKDTRFFDVLVGCFYMTFAEGDEHINPPLLRHR